MPVKLKRGQLVRVCKNPWPMRVDLSDEYPQGYSCLTPSERQYWVDRYNSITLSQMLTLYNAGDESKSFTHIRVRNRPGDLVTVINPRDRRQAPWRGNFVIVSCPRLGREYHIERDYLETIPESS